MLNKNSFVVFLRIGLYIVIFITVGLSLQSPVYATAVSLAVASLVDYFIFVKDRWSIGLSKKRCIYDFLKGLLGGSLTLIVIFTTVYIFGGHKIVGLTFDAKVILIWVVTCIIVALSEELFARGYVYGALKHWFGGITASIISSGIFTVFHLTRPGVSVVALSTLFFAGVLYTYMREKSGAVWLPIGFHFAWNFTSGIMGIWRNELILFETELYNNHLIHGGTYGIEGSLFTALFFLILTATALFEIKRLSKNSNE
ncbi:hypothetical protein FB479_102702 [Brevibacillus sp. AG162]|uniref:CPBP family intramembrane glutamic endopeptidase n=1 Tax=Brevibacillus sp. AG162 TaxID=2572910 RepID=UPI001150B1FD|nr:type II CAAX endopeptidase family protein [Brevibacillus sp. AG162]TQK74062.1 hypothetical protein FB479_102702 [Brevibacillus sp. AG162]